MSKYIVFRHMNRNSLIWTVIIIIIIIIGIVYALNRGSSSSDMSASPSPSSSPSEQPQVFTLASSAFSDGQSIPSIYTCDAGNTNPALSFNNVPTTTKTLALTMYDPDVPKQVLPAGYFDHWVVFNIPATTTMIEASSTPPGIQGNNGSKKLGYTGPCPPPQYEPKEHRYIFTAYALDTSLNLKKGATRQQVEQAIKGHVLATTTLTGRYQRVSQ
jgi:Raf kinase inhibitor-like YbhB/YbcL family protein